MSKSIVEQNADRRQRAEEQYDLYSIRLTHLQHRLLDGRDPFQRVVAVVQLKPEYVKPGEPGHPYTVTEFGCNCADSVKAREAGIKRTCKHCVMLDLYLARYTWEDEPEGYIEEEAAAEDTLSLVAAGRPSREEVRRRMSQDFPND